MAQAQEAQSKITIFLQKLAKDRSSQILIGVILGILVVGYIVYATFLSDGNRQGTWRYAVCRTFLELNHEFPQTIDILAAGEGQSDVTIFYNVRNSFGATEVNSAYCAYTQAQGGRVILRSLQINGEEVDRERRDKFSFTIPYIIYSNPDASLPPPLKGALDQIKKRKPFRIKIEGGERE